MRRARDYSSDQFSLQFEASLEHRMPTLHGGLVFLTLCVSIRAVAVVAAVVAAVVVLGFIFCFLKLLRAFKFRIL